jgi:hypothetical protein
MREYRELVSQIPQKGDIFESNRLKQNARPLGDGQNGRVGTSSDGGAAAQ